MAGAGSPRGHWASLDDCGGADPGAAHSNCPSSFSYQSVCALREENKKNNLFLSILLHWFGQCHSFQRSIYTGLRHRSNDIIFRHVNKNKEEKLLHKYI